MSPGGAVRARPLRPVRHRAATGIVATATVLSLLAIGCSSDDASTGSPPDTTASAEVSSASKAAAIRLLPPIDPAQHLPPNDIGGLRHIYDPALETMGLRLTRGALIDVSSGGYQPSNQGSHLALYVEPLDDSYSGERYVEGLWTISALLSPDVFARWSDVESYDICQEPPPSVDDSDEPLPYTQINMTRSVSDAMDWAQGNLSEMLATSRHDPDFKIVVNKQIRSEAAYRAASSAATTTVPGSSGS